MGGGSQPDCWAAESVGCRAEGRDVMSWGQGAGVRSGNSGQARVGHQVGRSTHLQPPPAHPHPRCDTQPAGPGTCWRATARTS